MQLQFKDAAIDLSAPVVMGILNVTPDSFSDGGRYRHTDAALRRAAEMVGEGAGIVDVGGESTRPGAQPVGVQEELDRVIPVIERIHAELGCMVSIDTMKAEVMDAACKAGASLINDVDALQAEGAVEVASRHRVAVCLMHMQGRPRSMQQKPDYADVVAEVRDFLARRLQACVAAGIPKARIVLDPGFGFGKNLQHNLRLLARLPVLHSLDCPLLVGLSRKSMLGQILGAEPDQRLAGSLALATLAVWQGAAIVRAHDVRATVDAVRVAAAVRAEREAV